MPENLKERVAAAAKNSGTTAHRFILEVIAEKAAQEELRADFDALAEVRFAKLMTAGETVSWQEMRAYLVARVAGKAAKLSLAR